MTADLDIEVLAIARGDAGAFARWLAGSEERVRASLRSFASVVDVEAVLQDSLIRVWQVAPRFVPDGQPHALVRLAIRIARNLAVSELRRTKTKPIYDAIVDEQAVDRPPPDPMLRAAIAECRDQLPAKPRAALDARLASAGDRDDQDLAASLRMQRNTFVQNFTRARKLLAECLGKKGIAV